MNAHGVRIVVGEGRSSQHGLLRFVLDGEGYDVVADAANPAELARILAAHKPDVVVLDDGIGATAVGMVREMVPGAKIVLVWPGAVVPIGGAAQVSPSRVLQELGPAVARVSGVAGVTAASAGAALVDEAKRDPDNLRRLVRGAGAASAAAAAGAIIVDGASAPLVILPVTPSVGPPAGDDVVTVPEADEIADVAAAGVGAVGVAAGVAAISTPAASAVAVGAQSSLNRRLGNLALGGAAVAGAIVLALALGGAKVPIAQVSGEAFTFTPPIAPEPGGGSGVPPIGGNGNHEGPGGGNHGGPGASGKLDFYPIQPYISSFLPDSSLPPVAGGPIPPVEASGRRGGLNQHHRHANTNKGDHARAGNRGS
ncbi:MAG TPA: hypothetical protein VIX62_00320 [Actinomycetota bacterium]